MNLLQSRDIVREKDGQIMGNRRTAKRDLENWRTVSQKKVDRLVSSQGKWKKMFHNQKNYLSPITAMKHLYTESSFG